MMNFSKLINNNAFSSSTYVVDSYDIWHSRLGRVNLSYIKKMVELSLIPKLSLKTMEDVKHG